MSEHMPFAGTTQNHLLTLLLRSEKPLSIEQLAKGLDVTKTAARQHILNLERDGYVVKTSIREGRGRPKFSYVLSREGRELFTRQYALFSEKMIALFKDAQGSVAFAKQMQAMGVSIAKDYLHLMPKSSSGAISEEALAILASLMTELGYDAKVSHGKEVIAHNCVYHHLADVHPEVCDLDLSLMQKLTGKKPNHVECMVRGGTCCRFKF